MEINMELHFLYISISGNTTSFIKRLSADLTAKGHTVTAQDVSQLNNETYPMTSPFVAFLPTYLEGGNGVDNGDHEILTNALGDFIEAHDNYKKCLGIVGSGNKNFNHQYCLTAIQYAKYFDFPFLADFEMRGTPKDIERIGKIILNRYKENKSQ